MKIKLRSAFAAFCTFALLLPFQNCSGPSAPIAFSDENKLGSSLHSEGNGYGYDGKIYLVLGSICPDLSNVRARIVTKSATSAELVRENCQEIAPVSLTAADFTINPANIDELSLKGSTFMAQVPAGGIILNLEATILISGFRYQLNLGLGTPADTMTQATQSQIQIYENGLALGPAHSLAEDIALYGLGRFRHWNDGNLESLMFSASDNSNPKTNDRVYSFKIKQPELIGANFGQLPKLTNPVDPRAFGAIGDGVTDNTSAFLAALNAGDLLIPDGNYVVRGTVRVPAGRSVQCTSLKTVKVINPAIIPTGNQATFQFW